MAAGVILVRIGSVFARVALAFAPAILVGCGHWEMPKWPGKKPPKAERVHPAPAQIGSIILVNLDPPYVLVDTSGAEVPAPGTALKVFRDGKEVGILTCGPVQRRPFVVADVASGDPGKGDIVFR